MEQLRDKAIDHAREISRFDSLAPRFHGRKTAPLQKRTGVITRASISKPPPADFVDRHLQTLINLGQENNRRIRDVLEGPVLSGKRGVNDFIDREAMDTELFQHRDDLSRWNRLLERITADRTMLMCAGRYHRSAWYYDAHEPKTTGSGLQRRICLPQGHLPQ
ncbi:hypothetical protein ACFS4T_15520 [Pseudomonas lini]